MANLGRGVGPTIANSLMQNFGGRQVGTGVGVGVEGGVWLGFGLNLGLGLGWPRDWHWDKGEADGFSIGAVPHLTGSVRASPLHRPLRLSPPPPHLRAPSTSRSACGSCVAGWSSSWSSPSFRTSYTSRYLRISLPPFVTPTPSSHSPHMKPNPGHSLATVGGGHSTPCDPSRGTAPRSVTALSPLTSGPPLSSPPPHGDRRS